ncbi:MAG: methyl-accepting chemotaxis protein [Proteobacteria bacterium]|nr:methyl-accepting chemotaxis protein [Pseudomonadota bacterium]
MSFSIRRSLQAVMLVLVLFGAIGGGIAVFAIRQLTDAIQNISTEHVKPLMLLKGISDSYAVTIVDTTHKTAAQAISWEEGLNLVRASEKEISDNWNAFMKKNLAQEEKALAREYDAMMHSSAYLIAKIIATMEKKDQDALKLLAQKELYPAIDPLTEKIDGLIKHQLSSIEKNMMTAQGNGAVAVTLQIAGGVVLLVVLAGGLFFVSRAVVAPLMGLRDKMETLAAGDTGIRLDEAERRNEIGAMARAVLSFQQNEIERRRLEAEGRKTRLLERDRLGAIEAMLAQFREAVASVRKTFDNEFGTMRDTSGHLIGIASQASNGAEKAREAAEFSSSNLETVGKAASELTSASREISQQVHKTSERVRVAMDAARQTDSDISGLVELGNRIGAIVGLINSIAEQTNMLALNATIEAARAGDAGRSFAVVASEVKNLADQTARATEEISQQISAIQGATDNAVSSLKAITHTVSEIDAQTTAIAAAVEEQEAATHEIARSISAASEGSTQAASNVLGVTSSINRTNEQANRLAGTSDKLGGAAEGLSGAVDKLLADLAADLEARRNESRRQLRQLVVIDAQGHRHPTTILETGGTRLGVVPIAGLPDGQAVTLEFVDGERRGARVVTSGGRQQMQLEAPLDAALNKLVA